MTIDAGEGFQTLRTSAGRALFDTVAAQGHDQALRMTSAFLHHSSAATELCLGLKHALLKPDDVLKGAPVFPHSLPAATTFRRLREFTRQP